MSVTNIALAQRISRVMVWKIRRRHEIEGDESLRDHVAGRPFQQLNPMFYQLVINTWKKYKCGARKMHAILKSQGYGVSLRKISQVLISEGFQKPFLKRRKPRKYKRYEWPIPNYMWHTDWHVIKGIKMRGENVLVFIDDCSRQIMSYTTGATTAENSAFALYKAIAKHSVTPFILNSDRGAHFFPNKKDKTGHALHQFQNVLEELGILFVPSKVRHPQTNGKNEKFFHILDTEFDERFNALDEFIEYYNTVRPSEALDYLTPNEAYKRRL